MGALDAIATKTRPCPQNYVQFFPVRTIAIVVLVGFVVLGVAVTAVARGPSSHRIAAALGVTGFTIALAASAATLMLAAGGFDSCWTF